MRPLVKNAADEGQVKEAGKKAQFRADRERQDMAWFLSFRQGRRIAWRYLSECGVFQSSHHPSGSQVYFLEGQRNIGLKLLADVTDASPDALIQMMKEAKEGELKDE